MRSYLTAEKNKNWSELYNLYGRNTGTPPFDMFMEDIRKANPTLIRFEVGSYELVSQDRALVLVSFRERIDGYIAEGKDEWWGCNRENGVWKIQWLPRQ